MKIGELNEHCGNCELIDYCAEPYESPQLCMIDELAEVEDVDYERLASKVTGEESIDKLRQYESDGHMPWDDSMRGAICDIVLEKLGGTGEGEKNL